MSFHPLSGSRYSQKGFVLPQYRILAKCSSTFDFSVMLPVKYLPVPEQKEGIVSAISRARCIIDGDCSAAVVVVTPSGFTKFLPL